VLVGDELVGEELLDEALLVGVAGAVVHGGGL